jgi:hypothetical protein
MAITVTLPASSSVPELVLAASDAAGLATPSLPIALRAGDRMRGQQSAPATRRRVHCRVSSAIGFASR